MTGIASDLAAGHETDALPASTCSAPGMTWVSCMDPGAPPSFGARLTEVLCPVCRQLVKADVDVCTDLDATCDAALARVLADCPYGPGRHRLRRKARSRSYPHPAIRIGAAA